MNDPAVLFYTSDFLTGVIDMTMEERGQYITLLCYQHQRGHIKEETIRLLVGLPSVNVLNHFKKDNDGLFYNERMDIEKEKRHNFTNSRRENGKKGGRPKEGKKEPNGKPKENLVVNHKGNLMGNENDNDNIIINNNKNIKIKYGSFNNVKLTDEEYQKLKDKFKDYDDKIENLSQYLAMKGDKYKNHYAVILNWARKDNKEENLPSWFNKEPEERIRTEDEERQLQELIRGNRR